MTHIVYLIKHLDTDMKYVGITSADLKTRWDQHRNDTNSAVYEALRADGHRMTMEVLEECDTREQALRREQEYIHELGTAVPRGWNRKINTREVNDYKIKHEMPHPYKKKWRKIHGFMRGHVYPLRLLHSLELQDIRFSKMNFDAWAPMDFHMQFAIKRTSPDGIGYNLDRYILVYNAMSIYRFKEEFGNQTFFRPYVWTDGEWHPLSVYKSPFVVTDLFRKPWDLIFWYTTEILNVERCDIYDYDLKGFVRDDGITGYDLKKYIIDGMERV